MWSYSVQGQQYGPVDEPTLQRMFQQGQLPVETYVWRQGMPDWQLADQVPAFAAYLGRAAAPVATAHAGGTQQGQAPGAGQAYGGSQAYGGHAGPQPLGYEGYVAQANYAGFWIRFLAYIIDAIILAVAGLIVTVPTGLIAESVGSPDAALAVALLGNLLNFVIGWLYYALMTSSEKQGTLGKMALGLKVVGYDYQRISFARATGRYFAKILSGLILLIGYIMAGLTERKQALHDFIASTYVLRP